MSREAFEDLDGRGLSGAVGSEKAETLASVHLEVEAGDRRHVSETLDEAATGHGGALRMGLHLGHDGVFDTLPTPQELARTAYDRTATLVAGYNIQAMLNHLDEVSHSLGSA